jgi:hypothetical protein
MAKTHSHKWQPLRVSVGSATVFLEREQNRQMLVCEGCGELAAGSPPRLVSRDCAAALAELLELADLKVRR